MLEEKEQTFALCRSLLSSYFLVQKEVAILFSFILRKPSEKGGVLTHIYTNGCFLYLTKFQ